MSPANADEFEQVFVSSLSNSCSMSFPFICVMLFW